MSSCKIVCLCKSDPSCNFVFVQFCPLVQKCLRAVLSPRANLTPTHIKSSKNQTA